MASGPWRLLLFREKPFVEAASSASCGRGGRPRLLLVPFVEALEGPRVRACTGHCFSFERSPSLRPEAQVVSGPHEAYVASSLGKPFVKARFALFWNPATD